MSIIWFHGWAGNPRIWHPISSQFLESEHHYPSFAEVRSPDDFIGCAADLLIQTGKALLIGWSLGGMIALTLAHQFPQCISGIILFNSTVRFCDDNPALGWSPRILNRMRRNLQTAPASVLSGFIGQLFSPEEKNQGLEERFIADIFSGQVIENMDFTIAGLQSGLDFLRDSDLTEIAGQINCPVLWVHTQQDIVCPVQRLLDYRTFGAPSTRQYFQIYPCGGHAFCYGDPGQASQLIKNFIQHKIST